MTPLTKAGRGSWLQFGLEQLADSLVTWNSPEKELQRSGDLSHPGEASLNCREHASGCRRVLLCGTLPVDLTRELGSLVWAPDLSGVGVLPTRVREAWRQVCAPAVRKQRGDGCVPSHLPWKS